MKTLINILASLGLFLHDKLFGYMERRGLVLCIASLPNGATLSLATTYGDAKTFSAISNANPAIATFASGHGLVLNDIIEVTSGWGLLNGRAVRVGDADDSPPLLFPLLGIDATNTTRFPPGSGIGTAREILTFTQITQVLGFTTTGGDPKLVPFQFLEEDFERQLIAGSTAQSLELTIADDDSLAGYIALQAASEAKTNRVLKLALVDGSIVLYNGVVHLNETPTVTTDEVMAVTATFALQGKPVRY